MKKSSSWRSAVRYSEVAGRQALGFEKYSGISRSRHLPVHTRPREFFGIADAKFLVNMQIKSYLYRGRGDLGSHSNNAK